MPSFFDALSYEFLRNALLAGVLAAVLCGVIGPFVVVKRLAFISDGISHAAFGGMGVCFFLGIDPILGAVLVAVASALALGAVDTETVRSYDAMIGVLWAVGLAVGIVFVYKSPGYAPNLMSYLFGNILMVSRRDVLVILALAVCVLAILALFWKGLVAVAFDEVFARVQGAPVKLLLTVLLTLIALSVVILIQVVGIILVVALLTIPPLLSLTLWKDLGSVVVSSVLVGVGMTLGGLGLSFAYDLPSGPAIILLGAALLLGVYGARRLAGGTRLAG
ncbi:MAG TPA: metal ABC transporter permease [Thermoanaerobaculia bacterium]|nr:metal ABC transporter permease [Thermoanaerobaculia bacterium]